jgi:alpha-mannosidase
LADEIKKESWLNARHILDWVSVGNATSTVSIATDHQFIRLDGGVIRGQMLRGARYTSVKVVEGDKVGVMNYPPAGSYVFCYSITSGAGDWKANKSYRQGLNLNNALIPISVADELSKKTLPPQQSYFSVGADNLILSTIKKADDDASLIVRVYENEGRATDTSVTFLGTAPAFRETNLLEEETPASDMQNLRARPYEIKTIKLRPDR